MVVAGGAVLAAAGVPVRGMSGEDVRVQPETLFARAVAADLGHRGKGDAASAFVLYRQAADAGLAAAQLNTAVMLDSGRGVPHDVKAAATYYAMAASQGVARAAYDLGQLYADGEGVPVNIDLARAWLHMAAASGLPAATGRLRELPRIPPGRPDTPTAPTLVRPAAGAVIAGNAALPMVWLAGNQPAFSHFYVEVAVLQGPDTHDVFSATVDVSAVTARLPTPPGRYAWRVFTVCQRLGRYVPSEWVTFSIT